MSECAPVLLGQRKLRILCVTWWLRKMKIIRWLNDNKEFFNLIRIYLMWNAFVRTLREFVFHEIPILV